MLSPLLCTPFITLAIIIATNVFSLKDSGRSDIVEVHAKMLTLASLFANLFYTCYLWKVYPIIITEIGYDVASYFPAHRGYGLELHHSLNLPFVILTLMVLIIAVLNVWYSRVNTVMFITLILLMQFFLTMAFSCSNIFVFLLFFELASLPIFILIAHQGSLRRERLKAGFYFLLFTIYGSLSVLILLVSVYGTFLSFNIEGSRLSWLLLFIAFIVKVPLFPFHVWLPFAHVEASSSVSIILAAIMLKLGGYGLIKFMLPLFSTATHFFFKPFALTLCVLSIVYGGYCALRQIDLKRQVAFSSISHMGFALLGIFSFSDIGVKGSIYLMVSHGLTSSALFFIIGVLSDRFHSRSLMAFSGLFISMPLFSYFIILFSLANVGFPGTSGFLPEFFILLSVLKSMPSLLFFVLLGMLISTAGTLLVLFRLLFGHGKTLYFKSTWADLTHLEVFVLGNLSCLIIAFGLVDFLMVAGDYS